MSEPAVLYAAEGGVATLTMNRPQVLNALNDDLLAGLRYNHFDANLTLSSGPAALATGVGTGWTDPFVGLRLRFPLNRQWTLTGYGDVGGFDPGSDLSWQASIGLRYAISGQFTADFGYRILKSEYETGGFLYDMRNDGLYAGVGIGF